MTEANNNSRGRLFELGALLLLPITIYVSFTAGRFLGFEGAELVGYSLGSPVATLIIIGLSQLIKRARTRRAISKIAFFTMLVFLVGTAGSLTQNARRAEITAEIDPLSFDVDEARAISLGLQIERAVRQERLHDINVLYDADHFMKKALRGEDVQSRYVQDIARGASTSFAQGKILEQIASIAKENGEFTFVKHYIRDGEPIVQFRVNDGSGSLHYLDFYLFKTAGDEIRIDDIRYYNSGDRLSKQIVASAANLDESLKPVGLGSFQNAVRLLQEGKAEEAEALIESLPDDTKQLKIVMRLRLQLAFQTESSQSDQLFSEFKQRFPDDPSIVFSAFVRATARDDIGSAVALLDEIHQIVNGDDYLLWYKVRLFVVQNNYTRAISTLSEMETKYGIDVPSLAEKELSEEFRARQRNIKPGCALTNDTDAHELSDAVRANLKGSDNISLMESLNGD